MNIILLSGGSGKRLWPLSDDLRSKQFIKMFKNNDGLNESMVQRVYNQIRNQDENANILIATSKNQVPIIQEQLDNSIEISIEPCRRDTFPAIVLAVSYMVDVMNIDENEAVVVCPVDPYVNNDYFEVLEKMSKQVCEGDSNLVLMGIEPTYPSEKYGYIIPETNENVSFVKMFKEKPTRSIAELYLKQGALWNGGVFAFKLKYVLEKAHEIMDFKSYSDLFEQYEKLERISFDYAVVEKEEKIQVMRFSGDWQDIGTWDAFLDVVNNNVFGKGIISETSENVHIVNELDIPIFVNGVQDVIVSATANGILVSKKSEAENIKSYVEIIEKELKTKE